MPRREVRKIDPQFSAEYIQGIVDWATSERGETEKREEKLAKAMLSSQEQMRRRRISLYAICFAIGVGLLLMLFRSGWLFILLAFPFSIFWFWFRHIRRQD